MVKRCCAKSCFNSQLSNRKITYFGFPKYISFAHEWAIAANRQDLLEKKLESITKYFLCAEHFTDDCFLDPPKNTRLRKTHHPLSIPIPTVFKSNFQRFVAAAQHRSHRDDLSANSSSPANVSLLNKNAIGRIQNDSIVIDLELTDDGNINYLASDNSIHHLPNYCVKDELDSIIEEDQGNVVTESNVHNNQLNELTCRLCANYFNSKEELCNVFSHSELLTKIDLLMPKLISPNDELPHSICEQCIGKVNACVDALESFRAAQDQIKSMYSEYIV